MMFCNDAISQAADSIKVENGIEVADVSTGYDEVCVWGGVCVICVGIDVCLHVGVVEVVSVGIDVHT